MRSGMAAVAVNGRSSIVSADRDDQDFIRRRPGSLYPATTHSWGDLSPLPVPLEYLAAAAIGGKIYAVGGTGNGLNAANSLYAYDPVADNWVTEAAMPTARFCLAAAAVGGQGDAVGGQDSNGNVLGNLEVYNPSGNSWTALPGMPTPREGLSVAVINGLLYAFGGHDDSLACP